MLRSDIVGELRPTIDQLHTWEGLAGIDLHGFEEMRTEPETAAVWAKLRAAGKVTKCHAGEFGGPERVREAIELCLEAEGGEIEPLAFVGVQRITIAA